ncbi:MAG: hypothetical protein HY537_16360 [Deltaproteobacteria bacterium]|nr:hypothetical protein [Deltaproteobacteria bacterium]
MTSKTISKFLLSQFMLSLCLSSSVIQAAEQLSVPRIHIATGLYVSGNITSEPYHDVRSGRVSPGCSEQLGNLAGATAEGIEVVSAANEHFVRRGWPKEFLDSRVRIAEGYADRSQYIYFQTFTAGPGGKPVKGDIEGAVGISWVTFDSKSLAENQPEIVFKDRAKLLPEEETLKTLVPRHVDGRGRGIAVEVRTYFKNKTRPRLQPKLSADLIQMVFELIKEYPELYRQPIIHTYADEAGCRLYEPLGFELVKEITPADKPIEADDIELNCGDLANAIGALVPLKRGNDGGVDIYLFKII